ncbi:MAG: ABC transporter ATP-binding protein [Sporolactobacillus sp.]
MDAILHFDHVNKSFQDGSERLNVLQDISFSIEKGEFVGLIGPSGAGKSTLLSLAGALMTPTSGQIYLDGRPIAERTPKEQTALRLRSIGFIFQSAHLVPYLTVKEQFLFLGKLLKKPAKQAAEEAASLLQKMDLTDRANHYPEQLSGGERQRVAIARAMANRPSLILSVVRSSSVDFQRAQTVIHWLSNAVKKQGSGALMVTHDSRMLELCDRVIQLNDGQLQKNS